MPIIRIEMWEGKTVAQKRELVETFTTQMSRITGNSKESIYVVIEDVKKENWGVAGSLCSDKFPDL